MWPDVSPIIIFFFLKKGEKRVKIVFVCSIAPVRGDLFVYINNNPEQLDQIEIFQGHFGKTFIII